MIPLVVLDITNQKRTLLGLAGGAVLLLTLLSLAMGEQAANGIPVLLIGMTVWGFAEQNAYQDEKRDMWSFLRALPLPPQHIVGARYLSTALVTLAFSALAALPLSCLAGGTWPVAVGLGAGAGLSFTSLFNAVHFRYGYRAASTWSRYAFFLICLLPLLGWALKDTPGYSLLAVVVTGAVAWLRIHPTTAVASVACSVLLLYVATWAYAARTFAHRDFPASINSPAPKTESRRSHE